MRHTLTQIIVVLALATIALAGPLEYLSSVNYSTIADLEVLDEASFAGDVIFNGDYIYVAFGYGGLITLDISSPEMPRATSREIVGNITNLEMKDTYLYALDETGNVVVFDIRDASSPVVASVFNLDYDHLTGFELSESIEGTPYLYTMKFSNSLVAMDISDPTAPVITGETALRGREAIKISQVSDFLAITTDDALILYDNYFFPNNPRWYANVDMISEIEDFTASGNIGIIGSSSDGARILRTNDYGDIVTEIASFSGVESAKAVAYSDNFAVVASEDELNVYDVHALTGTILVDTWSTSYTNHVSLNDESGIMVVSRGYAGIEILNARRILRHSVELTTGWNTVSVPLLPDDESTITSDVAAFSYDAVEGRYVEATDLEPGVGYFYFSTSNEYVDITGEIIESSTRSLVPGWNLIANGSHFVNVEELTRSGVISPVLFTYSTDSEGYEEESNVLSPGRSYWILAYDYTTVDLDNSTVALGRSAATYYSADDFPATPPALPNSNENIVENDPVKTELINIESAVSPFVSSTKVNFSLKETSNITAKVFDMTGKVVATLANSEMNSGSHQLSWTPSNETPNGVYFVSLSSDKLSESKKVIFTR